MRTISKNNSRTLEVRWLNSPWIFLKQVPPGSGFASVSHMCQADGVSAALAAKTEMFWSTGVCDVSCQCMYIFQKNTFPG